jgi:hypothetical protein
MRRYRYGKHWFRDVAVLWVGAWGTLLALIIAAAVAAWIATETSKLLPNEQTTEERK